VKQLLVFGLLLRALSAAAQPFDYLTFRMINDAQHPFPFYVDARVSSPAQLSVDGVQGRRGARLGRGTRCRARRPKAVSKGFTTGRCPNPLDSLRYLLGDTDLASDPGRGLSGALLGDGLGRIAHPAGAYAGSSSPATRTSTGRRSAGASETVTPRDAYDVESVDLVHEVRPLFGTGALWARPTT